MKILTEQDIKNIIPEAGTVISETMISDCIRKAEKIIIEKLGNEDIYLSFEKIGDYIDVIDQHGRSLSKLSVHINAGSDFPSTITVESYLHDNDNNPVINRKWSVDQDGIRTSKQNKG